MKRLDLSPEDRKVHLAALHAARNKKYLSNQEAMARRRARQRAWRAAHRDKTREYSRRGNDLLAATPERRRAYGRLGSKRYRLRHPRRVANLSAARNSALLTGCLDLDDMLSLVEYQAGRCAYCLTDFERPEVEHVVPLCRGGSHVIDNVVLACAPCNRRKGRKTWIPAIGHLAEADAIALLEYVRAEYVPAEREPA